ncbi:MAG TPA: VWA domain-containing protein [Thermoleophilaceae bacterium]
MADVEVDPRAVFAERRRRDALERARLGRRGPSLVSRRAGRYARHRLARRAGEEIALDATVRAAAARGQRLPILVGPGDLRRKIRQHRAALAAVFVVDNSYSLAAEAMLERVKGLALALLEDGTHRGDRVALVAFRGGVPEATVALPLTRSVALARRRLEQIPLSGRTPLPDALRRARRLLWQERRRHPNALPLIVAITDGAPTVPLRPGGDALADTLAQARELPRARIRCVVADVAAPGSPEAARGHAVTIARAARGTHVSLEALAPGLLGELLEERA